MTVLFCWAAVHTAFAAAASRVPMYDAPMALTMRKGQLELSLAKEKINDTLDVFGVKEGLLSGLAGRADLDLGAIGDLDGMRGTMNFGLSQRTTVRYVAKDQDIQFGSGTLNRVGHELAVRAVVKRGSGGGTSLAVEPIYRSNRGSGIRRTFKSFEAFGLIITPPNPVTLEFGGVKDETYALRFLASRHFSDWLLLSAWAEFGKTSVESELQTNLPVKQITDIVGALGYDSNQRRFGIGGHYFINNRMTAYAEYEHFDLDRDINAGIPNAIDTNDVVRGRLSYTMSHNSWLHLEGDYFSNNLGGEVPFIYNKLSASRFDKEYGFVALGATFQVSYCD